MENFKGTVVPPNKIENGNSDVETQLSLLLSKLPGELSKDQITIVENELKRSFDNQKDFTKESFKYALPFHPIKEAIEDSNSPYRDDNGEAAFSTFVSVTGMNIPIGLVSGFKESLNLLKKYRNLLNVRKEIRNREKIVS